MAYWSVEPTCVFCFSNDKLVDVLEYLILEYLIDHIYIVVGNRVFHQYIGIPMVLIILILL